MEHLENEIRYFQGIVRVLLTEIMNYRTLHIWQLNLHLCLLPNMVQHTGKLYRKFIYLPLTLLQRNRLASSPVKGEMVNIQ
jgi:hypothetical protein